MTGTTASGPAVLATLRTPAGTRAAIRIDDDTYSLLPSADVGALLREPGWRGSAAQTQVAPVDTVSAADADYAPLVTTPTKVLCCGHNYRGHIAEMGREIPTHPTIFAKFADTLIGAHDDIVIDAAAAVGLDWEAELAVVVGTTIRNVDAATARAAIAGYTVANDISIRPWQRHTGQWLPGKAFDATTPIGPVLVTAATPDTAGGFDPADGHEIRCTVNTTVEQKSDVNDLVFTAADLLAYISTFTTLRPGDVVLTGTPAGVGAASTPPHYLGDGDVVVTEIDGLGRCANRIVISPAPAQPTTHE
ncbi:fumarylacetoacetate hydrolase family protein [Gordonia sp. N1V]|uniref:fumarylacetoacetate hydrolase family protein n=1 Tax=Gordonia sp. N1V TaxID=3034163 RepID=UPI0023E28238|nr:fumarylacetoacetate hydrolase family protein [Gordonia sp. N1V]MDF3280771.1 fumarylacetoacetate hydrolase family protein [Gordonia sp. N1V]